MERILFTSRVKADEIWLEPAQPAFPPLLQKNISFKQFESELVQLIDYLRDSIHKRKIVKNRRRAEKIETQVQLNEMNQEYRRRRLEEFAAKKIDRKKWEDKMRQKKKVRKINVKNQQATILL